LLLLSSPCFCSRKRIRLVRVQKGVVVTTATIGLQPFLYKRTESEVGLGERGVKKDRDNPSHRGSARKGKNGTQKKLKMEDGRENDKAERIL
jgi:hypothetical protein